ncbi:MAG: hypothetical protein ABW096_00505 [Candidatus Thiodiazotropha sp.]
MKCLSIQLQPEKDTSHSAEAFIELSRLLDRYPEIEKGEDNGGYVNLNYFTEDLISLWGQLKTGIFENPSLGEWARKVAIVVAKGDSGWDDYLLLYHYDPSEKLDRL